MNKPYLIQRMKFDKNPNGGNFDGIMNLDYMGSSEFEWGALPKSLKVLCQNADDLVISKTEYYKEENGVSTGVFMITIGKEAANEYQEFLPNICNNPYDCKEDPRFIDSLTKKDDYFNTEAWWDIENHVMWTIGKANAKKIVNAIKVTRHNKKEEGQEGWY